MDEANHNLAKAQRAEDDPGFLERVMRYLDDDLSAPGVAAFESELIESAAKRRTLSLICLSNSLACEEIAPRSIGIDDNSDDSEFSMHESMQMMALLDEPEPRTEEIVPRALPQAPLNTRPWWPWSALAAAILLIAGLAIYLRSGTGSAGSQEIATLTATADAHWAVDPVPLAGNPALKPGTDLQLISGYAEVHYANGTNLVLEGPCDARLDSLMQLTMASGRVAAKVSESGHGFTVATAHGSVADFGTEFGVTVSNEATEVRVFVGRVQLKIHDAGPDQVVSLMAGDSPHVDASGVNTDPSAVSATPYATDIHQIFMSIPVHSTGQGLSQGSADPYWKVTSFAGNQAWQPAPAYACNPVLSYLKNDSRSAWISVEPQLENFPAGLYTFSTTFDVTNIDPTTVRLQMDVAVDDAVQEIRLNGKPTGLTLFGSTPTDLRVFEQLHRLILDRGFVAGVNRLDVVVYNSSVSAMALRVDVSGVGKQIVTDR